MEPLFKNMLLLSGFLMTTLIAMAQSNTSVYSYNAGESVYSPLNAQNQVNATNGMNISVSRSIGLYQAFENSALVKTDMELGYALPFSGIENGPGSGDTELNNDGNSSGNVDTPLSLPNYFFAFMLLVYLLLLMYKRIRAANLR